MKKYANTFATLCFLAVGFANAADKSTSSLKAADENFVKQAGASGSAEIKLATLGSEKAERADVKKLAETLVKDHTKISAELTSLAQKKGVELSAVIDPKAAESFQELEKVSGKDFDKAFLSEMEKCHRKAVSAFEDAEKNATDADVKSWAGKTLPELKNHLASVKDLESK